MIEQHIIQEELYKKYIEPTKQKKEDYIGIEIEIPIVNLKKEAVDFDAVHAVTDEFIRNFQFQEAVRDDEGNISAVTDSRTGDILSYDCSYNNLELSLGREKELHELYRRFREYYGFLQQEFKKYGHALTGMGVNPYRIYNHNVPIPNGRYRMLFHHLHSYKDYHIPMYFHAYPEFGTFSSASQVQLDVHYDDLLATIGAFSKAEPVKALLFSNSVLLEEHEELLCCRDTFWENSTHGINPHNIGMFDCEFETVEDLMAYIESTSIYCTERDGKYINFPPVPVMEYFRKPQVEGEYYENGSYKKILIQPKLEDIQYLRTFKFEDLTFRGTIEYRSVCCQPIKDCMTVAAFHLGLKERIYELDALLKEDHVIYHQGYTAAELRKMFNKRGLPGFVDADALYALAGKVVDLARDGLKGRGFGEESLLAPLYDRIKMRTNPAKRMLEMKEQGVGLENIILEYGELCAQKN